MSQISNSRKAHHSKETLLLTINKNTMSNEVIYCQNRYFSKL